MRTQENGWWWTDCDSASMRYSAAFHPLTALRVPFPFPSGTRKIGNKNWIERAIFGLGMSPRCRVIGTSIFNVPELLWKTIVVIVNNYRFQFTGVVIIYILIIKTVSYIYITIVTLLFQLVILF